MKRYCIFVIAGLLSLFTYAQDAALETQLLLHSFKESRSYAGMDNLSAKFLSDWPKDVNGDKDCALVRISFEQMPKADARTVNFSFGNSAPVKSIMDRLDEAKSELWIFVTPTTSAYMEAEFSGYGKSNRLPNLNLEPRRVYDVVLKNNKTLPITIITQPEKARVSLVDLKKEGVSPATIQGVPCGNHRLIVSVNGEQVADTIIEVSDFSTLFKFDFRKEKIIKFVSDPSGADLIINGKTIGKTPMSVPLKYDSYHVEARLSADEYDMKDFTVSDISDNEIKFEPIEKKSFEVYATYNGNKVDADLYIDGEKVTPKQPSYQLHMPVGNKHKMVMTYYGNSKKRTIKVSRHMNVEQHFKISARNSFVWPWQREYDARPVGFSAGYVTKQWVSRGNGEMLKENVWGDEGKWLHGFQMGLHFQPCFSWGLGLYTGLFYEFYTSWNSEWDYDNFQEHCLYVPAHLFFRIPFAEKVALSVHGGLGLDCGLYASFKDSDNDSVEPLATYYGEEAWPKRFNAASEIGVGLRIGSLQISALYSKGFFNHKFYTTENGYDYDYKTTQNKYAVSISWLFSSN